MNILYPKLHVKNIKEITKEVLDKNDIKGLILDVDNTLIYYNKELLDGVDKWCEELKIQGISFCILSNSGKKEKLEKVSNAMKVPYLRYAKKPLKKGFLKAKDVLKLDNKNIGVVGDQIFTDVIGANRVGMFPILVEPIDKKDIWITKIKRPMEKLVLRIWGQSPNTHKWVFGDRPQIL